MISFLSLRKYSYSFSIFLTLVLIVLSFSRYKKNGSVFSYSVEFTGGTQIKFSTSSEFSLDEIIILLKSSRLEGFTLRQFSNFDFLLRLKGENMVSLSKNKIEESLNQILNKNRSEVLVTIHSIDHVGSGFGAELKYKVFIAVFMALICMFLYVWFRFKTLAFAFANLISLGHDVLIILLFALIANYEFSYDIVGAILFILGYSINDTIVIFSKIRENIKEASGETLFDSVDRSIRETLRRTLLTSIFTTLVVVPLVLFGGESLQILSSSLLLGIVFGTYSSIFIAAPLVYNFKQKID